MKKKTQTSKKESKVTLKVDKRSLTGKKAKKLRKQGIVPGNIYGKDFKSKSIQVDKKEFRYVFSKVKRTSVLYLKLGDKEIPSLISTIQYHPVNQDILHVEFRKINLKSKVETTVPVKIIGTSEALEQKKGELSTPTDRLLIKALPTDIPNFIEVDISKLKEVGDEVKVNDLSKSSKYEILEDGEKVLASITHHHVEEIKQPEPEETEEEAKEGEEGKSTEGKEEKTEAKEGEENKENKPQE